MTEPDRHHLDTATTSVAVVPGGPVRGAIRPPGSKSLTNRALICAAFADGVSTLTGALSSEDTEVMIEALRSIGVAIDVTEGGRRLVVDGSTRTSSPATSERADLFIANSGTSVRFLTAALSAAGGHYRLHGVERMHERPIGDLIDALQGIVDGSIAATSPGHCPPVEIDVDGWHDNEQPIPISGSVSSQYLSGLMMAAPIARRDRITSIQINGELVSLPYVAMTAAVIRSFGGEATMNLRDGENRVFISATPYQPTDYDIEPDASAASYFWAAAAITEGRVTVEGLRRDALQGDVGFCDVLAKMGCDVHYNDDGITVQGRPLSGIDVDMNQISDTVQTLSVVALFAAGPTRITGVAHNRFKETDRIGDLARELRKLGARIEETDDGLEIHPPSQPSALHGAVLETYNDHRMAMSLSLAGLRLKDVQILNPACTAKTYPNFFADLEQLIGRAHQWSSDVD